MSAHASPSGRPARDTRLSRSFAALTPLQRERACAWSPGARRIPPPSSRRQGRRCSGGFDHRQHERWLLHAAAPARHHRRNEAGRCAPPDPRFCLRCRRPSGQASGFARLIYKTALRKFLRDKDAADQILQRSGLDWTIVYPVNLKDAPALPQGASTKSLSEVARVPGFPTLPFDNAAAALLDVVTDPGTSGQRLLITTPTGFTLAT